MQMRAERPCSPSAGDRDLPRVLALLEANRGAGVTIATLRERGIETPAMSVYELQLAGCQIERVLCERPDGCTTLGYRLRAAPVPTTDQSGQLKEVDSDEIPR
ncbi:MAG TPA: hypothetical protein VLP43_11040 [Solirubrobacteraceae bacterium]|nr:hypothetical protein [Solirubrobacteraceae bacterium]